MTIFEELHYKRQFDAWWELKNLEKRLDFLIEKQVVREVPVKKYLNWTFKNWEKWYLEISTGIIYRYIKPDYPFQGIWERVTNEYL